MRDTVSSAPAMDRGTTTGTARCATGSAPMRSVNGSPSGAEYPALLFRIVRESTRSEGHSFASSPRSRLGRDDRGFLDLTDNGELVLDREVGNQHTNSLASVI